MTTRQITIIITRSQIQKACLRLADQIRTEYGRTEPFIFLVTMDGAMRFGADLLQLLDDNAIMMSVKAKSYTGTESSRVVLFTGMPDLGRKRVLVVEDIVDTGHTIANLLSNLSDRTTARVRVCTLLHKPSKSDFIPDFVGFELKGDPFVVGYGLDLDGLYRNRNSIYDYKGTEE